MLTLDRDARTAPRGVRAPVARRRLVGAEPLPGGGVHFRVWAPERQRVEVVYEGDPRPFPLAAEDGGYWSGLDPEARVGSLYRFRLDDDGPYPDPASRFQPRGPFGPSEVIDPAAFSWTDQEWRGIALPGQVIYELHVGTFTPEGTWQAARARLPDLRQLGVTALELMPLAEFPGAFGWGYDGVDLFAPYHGYGRPDELRSFVDEAHRLGLAVLLDVVYNHLGPDGNFLRAFSRQYFSDRATEWGEALNYDGPHSGPVRELMADNAAYWISEFHLDGLRFDATQSMFDDSEEHVLVDMARRARAAAGARSIVLVAENEPQHTRLVRPLAQGGYGLDALWNDDLHHSAVVALTGRKEAYYLDYLGTAPELLAAVKHGYLYQGQRYLWQKKRRGTPARGLPASAFVAYVENHDQVANSCRGDRLWQLTSPGRHRAMTGLLLLAPWTPMLFQGQEWNASSPFVYFADHKPELAALVRKGRAEFLAQFRSCATPEMRELLCDPGAPASFERCRLDWDERAREPHRRALALHRDLLALRREDPVLRAQGGAGMTVDGAVLSDECLVLRHFAPDGDDRLLVVNLGRDLHLAPAPEPLLAPPEGRRWATLWSSEDPRYGGTGTPPLEDEADGWRIPGHAAVLLRGAAAEGDGSGNPDRLAAR